MKKLTLVLGLLTAIQSFAQSEIKTTVGGDMRLRHESYDSKNGAGKDVYDILRLRARLSVKSQINETLSTEFRLATGTGGTATNQTFSGTRNYDFKLDRAFAKYAPNENVLVKAGRTDNPYIIVGEHNMLFDADLNFDGASVTYLHKAESFSAQLIFAHAILVESTSKEPNADAKLNSAELALRFGSDTHGFLATFAEHSFQGLRGHASVVVGATAAAADFQGNSFDSLNYRYNYDVTAVGLEYTYKGGSVPMTAFAEMANNNATSEEDTAVIYGVKFNKLKKKGDWMVSVDSREVEADSTLAAMTDGDTFAGGTDGRSLNTTLAYNLEDNANVMLTYLNGKTGIAPGGAKLDRNRLQVDLNIKF